MKYKIKQIQTNYERREKKILNKVNRESEKIEKIHLSLIYEQNNIISLHEFDDYLSDLSFFSL